MSVCGGDALDRVVVVPGPPGPVGPASTVPGPPGPAGADGAPGVDGKDGVVDPALLVELPDPGDDTGVVVVDSGDVKFSRWSAFKARIAQWLSSGPEAVSADTQTDLSDVPEVRSVRLGAGNTPYRSFTVLDHRAENPGGVPYNGLAFRIGYDGSGAQEADSWAQLRARKGGLVIHSQHVDGVSPSHIVLAPSAGNVYIRETFGAVSAAAVPGNQVVTGSNVMELRNKTLVSPTITNPTIENPVLVNPDLRKSDGTPLALFFSRGTGPQVNFPRIASSGSGTEVVLGVDPRFGDDDVDLHVLPKGSGELLSAVGTSNPSGVSRVVSVAVRVPLPATPGAAGSMGQYAADDLHLYVCVADGNWKRVAWDAW